MWKSLCSCYYFNRKLIKLSLRRVTHFFHFTRISRMEVRVEMGRWPAAQSNPQNLSFCRVISLQNRCYWGAQCSFWHNVQETRWDRKRKLANVDTQMFIWQTKILILIHVRRFILSWKTFGAEAGGSVFFLSSLMTLRPSVKGNLETSHWYI